MLSELRDNEILFSFRVVNCGEERKITPELYSEYFLILFIYLFSGSLSLVQQKYSPRTPWDLLNAGVRYIPSRYPKSGAYPVGFPSVSVCWLVLRNLQTADSWDPVRCIILRQLSNPKEPSCSF